MRCRFGKSFKMCSREIRVGNACHLTPRCAVRESVTPSGCLLLGVGEVEHGDAAKVIVVGSPAKGLRYTRPN
jgi:hypothetical protein